MWWTEGLVESTRFLQTLQSCQWNTLLLRYLLFTDCLPASSVILAITDVIFEVHLDLIAETLDPVNISQTSCVRIKEHDRLQILLCSCATPWRHVFLLTLRQANSVSSIWIALNGITSSFMTRTPMSLTTVSWWEVFFSGVEFESIFLYLGLWAHVNSPISDISWNDHVIAEKKDVLKIHRPSCQPQKKMFASMRS